MVAEKRNSFALENRGGGFELPFGWVFHDCAQIFSDFLGSSKQDQSLQFAGELVSDFEPFPPLAQVLSICIDCIIHRR